jgi:hypothetical protein
MGAWNRVGIGLSNRPARAGIFKNSMGARHRLGIGLSYRPARLHRLAELMPWHRFLGSIKVYGYICWRNRFLGIDSWDLWRFKNSSSGWKTVTQNQYGSQLYLNLSFFVCYWFWACHTSPLTSLRGGFEFVYFKMIALCRTICNTGLTLCYPKWKAWYMYIEIRLLLKSHTENWPKMKPKLWKNLENKFSHFWLLWVFFYSMTDYSLVPDSKLRPNPFQTPWLGDKADSGLGLRSTLA